MNKKFIFIIIFLLTLPIFNLIAFYVWISLFKVNVVFYSSLYSTLIISFSLALIIFLKSYFNFFNLFEKFQIILVSILIGYIFSISIPTVIDRSVSIYLLEKLNQSGNQINYSDLENIFRNEYLKEHRVLEIRLTEQENSGTISIKGNCVSLTNLGKIISNFTLFFRSNFLPKNRLIMNNYSDELTNIFNKNRKEKVKTYSCH
jgi:hypothetical protein